MKKKIKNNLFGFFLGAILVSITTVYAASKIYATSVSIDPSNISGLSTETTLDSALSELYKKTTSAICPDGYKCIEKKSKPSVGDYVKMTPTSTSFTLDTNKTGYDGTQSAINPSELNLWRVIKINNDGTIEMVSEHVSSTAVYFKGKTGYKNLVGYLNVLANQYQNTKYTIKARHIGYNGQTEYLSDTANTVDSTSTTVPWTSSTGSSTVESKGGGDTLYTKDTDLVKSATGTLVATNLSGNITNYWLASRYYYYANYGSPSLGYSNRIMLSSGSISYTTMYNYSSGFNEYGSFNFLRPILTLKSEISYTPALGTSDDPFVLS